jgi:hypothetical protein
MDWLFNIFGQSQEKKAEAAAVAAVERIRDVALLPIEYMKNKDDVTILDIVGPHFSTDETGLDRHTWGHLIFVNWAAQLAAIASIRKAYKDPEPWIRLYLRMWDDVLSKATTFSTTQRTIIMDRCESMGRDWEAGVTNLRPIYEATVFGKPIEPSIDWIVRGQLALNNMLKYFITLSDKLISFIPRQPASS